MTMRYAQAVLCPMCGHWVNGGLCAEAERAMVRAVATTNNRVRNGDRREGRIRANTSYLIEHENLKFGHRREIFGSMFRGADRTAVPHVTTPALCRRELPAFSDDGRLLGTESQNRS